MAEQSEEVVSAADEMEVGKAADQTEAGGGRPAAVATVAALAVLVAEASTTKNRPQTRYSYPLASRFPCTPP
eukprot:129063-Prymnesium_polylepis.1